MYTIKINKIYYNPFSFIIKIYEIDLSSSFSNCVNLIDDSNIVISSSSKRVITFDNIREAPAE